MDKYGDFFLPRSTNFRMWCQEKDIDHRQGETVFAFDILCLKYPEKQVTSTKKSRKTDILCFLPLAKSCLGQQF